jgi:hypothetical protein
MKKILIIFYLLLSNIAFAQENNEALLVDGKLPIDSMYSNKNELILYSGIHKFDSISQSELKNKVKNWASLTFVNLKEVMVSETDDQIVLNYISSSYYVKSLTKTTVDWYIRLLIQFKDGKIRCTYYDDGNVRMLPTQYSPGYSARIFHLKDYFKEKDGVLVSQKSSVQGMLNLHNSIIADFNSIKESINNKTIDKKNDW